MEKYLALRKELSNKSQTFQTQGQQFKDVSQRNRELEDRYQHGLQELALKEKLLQQALLEKSVLEKTLEDGGGPQHSRLVTELQERLQQSETRKARLEEDIRRLQQSALQVPAVSSDPKNSGRSAALEHQVAQLHAELKDSREYVQELQQELAKANITDPLSSSARGSVLKHVFPASLDAAGTLKVLGTSPDNKKIAYLESSRQQQRLFIFNNVTGQTVRIGEWADSSVQYARLAWAFDSEHFLFAAGSPQNYTLYLGNSRSMLGQAIVLPEAYIAFAWSPTQLRYAYLSGANLIVKNLQQQTLSIRIGHQPGLQENSLAWSPDGQQIAFCGKRGASFDIFLLNVADNAPSPEPLVASSSDDLQPSWSPDGRYVAFYVRTGRYDTKVAVSPSDKSRTPYIVGHNASLPPERGPLWLSGAEVAYVGEEHLLAAQNSVYVVNVGTGQRSSAPLSMLLGR
ncbi:hypothetical protein CSB45_09200 [candidate division KSB3 bacterium]|uniref:Dipeptidylpeptidase IV N-terminal domain-containing protein n=1 Tax=candidate division KSB3 bacterium TaxID=2044937 RepID=A0A2G6E444_9BACT|nr:MAG: hypothetical protein CSB45_09200 [candidate division KSB3 bacterium]